MSFNHINSLGEKRKPFLVISDFKAKKINVIEISELEKYDIKTFKHLCKINVYN